ncbi:MAG: P-loop NTPase, partial [Methyloprofundus sp.]|nr:P-loop NTPase [Methyloprofundus sp.]
MAAVIAFTSGKGGVGKTNIATNIGLSLVARQEKVCLFDAD